MPQPTNQVIPVKRSKMVNASPTYKDISLKLSLNNSITTTIINSIKANILNPKKIGKAVLRLL